MKYQVWRDGKPESPEYEDEREAHRWLLRNQSQSVYWACQYEGWEIREIGVGAE